VALGAVTVLLVAAGCSDTPSESGPTGGPAPSHANHDASIDAPIESGPGPESPSSAGATTSSETNTAAPVSLDGTGVVSISEQVATGLNTPWDVDFLPDGSALVSLRDQGKVMRLDRGTLTPVAADGPDGAVQDVWHRQESGLLGLAIGPNQDVFLYLTTEVDNRVVRYELAGDSLINPQIILDGIPAGETHDGGRLAFGPDGYLYVSTGDARQTDLPQDTNSLAGKILRLTSEGEPAPGNPFGNEVWSFGHRNVQGLGWTSDGRMYASEFGENRYDELNLIEPGGNYGWPHIEGWAGHPDYVDPLVTWSTKEASPSGIAVTDAGIWMSALRGERLWFVPFTGDGQVGAAVEHRLGLGRLRHVVTTPEGDVWVVTSNTDGRGDPREDDDQIVRLGSH